MDDVLRLPIDAIVINRDERQRKKVDDLNGLQESIRTLGLLNPIIINPDNVLVAGERRYTACKNLGWDSVPVRYTTDLSPIELQIVELEENIKRKDLTWQESAAATNRIHQLRTQLDPSWKQIDTAESLSVVPAVVTNHLKIAEKLSDSRVAECKTMTEALTMIERTESRKRSHDMSVFLRRKPAPEELDTSNADNAILNSSFLDWAPTYDGPRFNFIHCDFPYGIGVADGPVGQGNEHTFYEDSAETATLLLDCFVNNISRLFEMSGHIMFWYSDKNRAEVERYLSRIGGVMWIPHPLIWVHAESGITPDYRRRPKHVYDTCMLGTRNRFILKVLSDVFACPVDTQIHPSTKPEAMLKYFMGMLVDGHTTMLDPTCGSGSSLRAAEALGAKTVLGLEINEGYCKSARLKLKEARLFRGSKREGGTL
jgi:ParB family chromosome partitioning protein